MCAFWLFVFNLDFLSQILYELDDSSKVSWILNFLLKSSNHINLLPHIFPTGFHNLNFSFIITITPLTASSYYFSNCFTLLLQTSCLYSASFFWLYLLLLSFCFVPAIMSRNKGKAIVNSQNTESPDNRNNTIITPLRIQKLDLCNMGTRFFQDTEASTSEGQNTNHGFYTSPAKENPRTNQETHNQNNGESPNFSEGIFSMYEDEHIGEGIKQCKNNIIGKILAPKQISKQVLHSSLMGIWCNHVGFKITELENNRYQFSFEKETNITRSLKGEPWIIRNVWLKLHLWNRTTNIQEFGFPTCSLMDPILGFTTAL